MLEQIIARNPYEVMKLLPSFIRIEDFNPEGLSYFSITLIGANTYQITYHQKVYHDEMLFMEEVSSKRLGDDIFGFVCYFDGEVTLGFRGPSLVGEYILEGKTWVLREYEDFNLRQRSWAEERFEVTSDFESLKKSLS